MSGFVYIIGSPELEWVKIGYAGNVRTRLRDLQVASPFKLSIEATIPCSTRADDKRLHRAMHLVNRRGEWFQRDFIIEEMIEKARAGCSFEAACEWVAMRIDQYRQTCAEIDFERLVRGWAATALDEDEPEWARAASRNSLRYHGREADEHRVGRRK